MMCFLRSGFFLAIIILLAVGCGTLALHNPYKQSISEAIAPDQFNVSVTRDNEDDSAPFTVFAIRWDLK